MVSMRIRGRDITFWMAALLNLLKILIGKKIAVNTLGAHHEFVIKEYLHRAGLTAEEIKQVTLVVVPPVTTEQTLRAEQIDVAALGGVLRDKALERGGIHPLFKDMDLFGNFSAGSYVLTDKFIKANPNASRKFVEATAKAIEWARTTPRDEVVARFEKIINATRQKRRYFYREVLEKYRGCR